VRFINVQAHKEKYHFFVDVDKCNLCGKVSNCIAEKEGKADSAGGEVPCEPPLPSADRRGGQGEQDRMPQVRVTAQNKGSTNVVINMPYYESWCYFDPAKWFFWPNVAATADKCEFNTVQLAAAATW
jgi:hypothetical protein